MVIDRRNFIKASSVLAAGMVTPAISASAKRNDASDRLNIGLIGCKNMGWGDLNDILKVEGTHCVALCDVDQDVLDSRAGEIAKRQGKKPFTCKDYRKLLDNKDVDIVVIGTPDHWHCLQTVDACKAGKDVYVEKPLANSIAECDAMVDAARRYKRIVQVGQQQRSSKHFREMVDYLRSGKLGRISRAHVYGNFTYAALPPAPPDTPTPAGVDYDLWLGPAPLRAFNQQRFHGTWRMFWDYGGGLITDWGVHLIDMALWGMNVTGMPLRVLASGGKYLYPNGGHETFDTMAVTYQFKDFIIEWENNTVENGPYGRNYGIVFQGENGLLVANREDWQVYPERDKVAALTVKPDYKGKDAHAANFIECVRSRNPNTACTIENGRLCATYAHLGNIAAKTGQALVYDDKNRKFNVSEAEQYRQAKYRGPWRFPEI